MHLFNHFINYFKSKISVSLVIDDKTLHLLYARFLEDCTPVSKPEIIVFGGGPGTGKTTFRKIIASTKTNFHLHDIDEVMVLLPGYQQSLTQDGAQRAFESWWPYSQMVVTIIVHYAISKNLNILYDRTCGTEESLQTLQNAKRLGYHMTLYGFYVDITIALQRTHARATLENRVVTDEITVEYARRFSTLWPRYLYFIDTVYLFDSKEGKKPIFLKNPHEMRVIEPEAYQAFLSCAFDDTIAKTKFPKLHHYDPAFHTQTNTNSDAKSETIRCKL